MTREPGRFVLSVIVGSIPAFILGFALHDTIKAVLFESPLIICWALLRRRLRAFGRRPAGPRGALARRLRPALPPGFPGHRGRSSASALIPGVSRSGATITGGLLLGLDKRAATEFSFFLAIPAMVGAFALDFYKSHAHLSHHSLALIAVGFVVAFISALGVIKLFLDYVGRHGFWPFALWRIAVGGVGLAAIYFTCTTEGRLHPCLGPSYKPAHPREGGDRLHGLLCLHPRQRAQRDPLHRLDRGHRRAHR